MQVLIQTFRNSFFGEFKILEKLQDAPKATQTVLKDVPKLAWSAY